VKTILWKIYPLFLLIVLLALGILLYGAVHVAHVAHYEWTEKELTAAAALTRQLLAARAPQLEPALADEVCKTAAAAAGYRVTVVLPDGAVIGDSEGRPAEMENHAYRPEIRDAYAGRKGVAVRYSATVRKNMMYVALPYEAQGRLAAVVRTALPVYEIERLMRAIDPKLGAVGLAIAVAATLLSLAAARAISRPLLGLRQGAMALAAGDLSARLPRSDILEIDTLAETVNGMADELHQKIDTLARQMEERQRLLACMDEGVVAVDRRKEVSYINQAAARVFNVAPDACLSRSVVEVIRNADLHALVERTLAGTPPLEGEIFLAEEGRYLEARGAQLGGPDGPSGAVIVLHEVTRLRRLEQMRRDFVANVSHELKTPVTSIKGAAETLLDGAADDPQDRERFLRMILRQAERLTALLDDLLTLSRLEHGDERDPVRTAAVPLRPILDSAVHAVAEAAAAAGVRLEIVCPAELGAVCNERLTEQAVVNLLDNAIKHGGGQQTVRVTAERVDNEAVIRVRDEGPGIPAQHVPRVFERFYRVDRSRSRELGGTGLGLAIVKHIALAQGGRVELRTREGQGCEFSIYLPAVGA